MPGEARIRQGEVRLPRAGVLAAVAACLLALAAPTARAAGPAPGSPEYTARDAQNIADAYGRQTGPGGQLTNPAYLPALVTQNTAEGAQQLLDQAARPSRPALDPGALVPGWNVGNPLRAGWNGSRGRIVPVTFTNRYGALLVGDVFAPLENARDPYTGEPLRPPYPAVVITPGSVQGSERMYWWLAEDLAERGYVVLTYDVQGEGRSETLPHVDGPMPDVPFCDPLEPPRQYEETGCPGVPFQQLSNFIVGTRDALSFVLSTPTAPYDNPSAGSTKVDRNNPLWQLVDHSPDRRSVTSGRTTRAAIIGHSMGAFAISYVQGVDDRVETAVALDKLTTAPPSNSTAAGANLPPVTPVVPALGLQSEYGFTVSPWFMSGGSSFTPSPSPSGPDPKREEATGFDGWRKAGVDTMVVVPRASTHLEYTDIPYVLPASRYGQDLSSVYTQNWLGWYLKHDRASRDALFATSFRYLEPVGNGKWEPVTLDRDKLLSFYYCSGWSLGGAGGAPPAQNVDVAGVGCR